LAYYSHIFDGLLSNLGSTSDGIWQISPGIGKGRIVAEFVHDVEPSSDFGFDECVLC